MFVDIDAKAMYFHRRFFGGLSSRCCNGAAPATVTAARAKSSVVPPKNGNTKKIASPVSPTADEDRLTLVDAVVGKVVTRFPPEASGFLHIGHAKAALINRMLADKYKGKLVFRFDDTNPEKENAEFENICMEDLALLGVGWDMGPTYSSDYMDLYVEKCNNLIDRGLAYCDTCPREEMQKARFDGIPTPARNNSVKENHRLWLEMQKASEEGCTACVRAKISIDDPNKALRDPVIFRVNTNPHARQGRKYNVYPTYDFCCPIVDSVEGITHALRTNEYHDRNAQYYWFIEAMGLRKPLLEDFSRLNMEYSLMSKRKLTQLVNDGVVEGWDDPRFPTVRALVRRGLKIEALKNFVKEQGMSKCINWMEWSKLWNYNVQILDPSVPRYTAVSADLKCVCTVLGGEQQNMEPFTRARHKKNPELGTKTSYRSNEIILEAEDVALLKDGDEVTLMDWGNAFVKNINKDSTTGLPIHAELELHLDGDVKKTKYKLTWLPKTDKLIPLECREYDYILTKKKPDPEEPIDNLIAKNTKHIQKCLGEPAMAELKKGDTVQLERKGYYIVDTIEPHFMLIAIPDGREKVNHLSAKYQYLKANPPIIEEKPKSKSQLKKAKTANKPASPSSNLSK